jgi:formate hydrogenlyase transcriptional activator
MTAGRAVGAFACDQFDSRSVYFIAAARGRTRAGMRTHIFFYVASLIRSRKQRVIVFHVPLLATSCGGMYDQGVSGFFTQRAPPGTILHALMVLRSRDSRYGVRHTPVGRVFIRISLIVTVAAFSHRTSDAAAPATSESAAKRVLVIYSDERVLPANVIEDDAIRRTFAADPTVRVEFHSEFLDVARFSRESYQQQQADFFREKYAERPPDLIISGGQPALTFLVKHRGTLFTNVPVVAHGAIESRVLAEVSDPRIVGVPNAFSLTGTIELALHMHPRTQQIAVVAGAGPRDRGFADAARRALEPFEPRLRVRWLTNQSMAELKKELASLPDHTVVLYLTMFGDQSGNSFVPPQALAQFAPASRAPIYGAFDTYIGSGAVGTSCVPFEMMGRKSAEVGMRILAGMDPQDAVRGERYQPISIFDWRQLQRLGISEAQLPADSVVRFKEYSIWERYRWRVIGVITLCVVESVLIVALVFQLRRRRRAEALRRESDEQSRQATEAARESEARFLVIANAAPVLIWISGLDKRCNFFNQPWLEFTGRTLEQETGNGWADGVHPEDLSRCLQIYTESFDARQTFTMEYRLRRHDGEYRWLTDHGVPRYNPQGDFVGYIGSCVDITERKLSEERLRRTLEELEQVKERLDKENTHLRQEVTVLHGHQEIVGQSPELQQVLAAVEQVADTDATVLVLGETGTGKELIARAIHKLSPRRDKAMICVNCAAIPATLIESELFGREKGAYTGAMSKQLGRFEAAHRSTLFLDEVGELPPEVQVKLLRVLQEKEIERLGSSQPIKVDVRIVAATNRDLEQAVRDGRFRQDLYYRLTVFPIKLPPLRERPQDIPLLVMAFVEHFSASMGKQIDGISKPDLAALQRYPWPGNIRELRNAVERAMILAKGTKLRIAVPSQNGAAAPAPLSLDDAEREHILKVLSLAGWRVQGAGGAADLLGMKRTTLESRMSKLGIQRPGKKAEISASSRDAGYPPSIA